MKCSFVAVLLVGMALAILTPAGAADLVFTFENPPYVVADLVGQDGWTGTAGQNDVWAGSPLSGSQSVTLTGNKNSIHSTSSVNFTNDTQISWLQRLNDLGASVAVGTMDNPYTANAVLVWTNGGTINALSGASWLNLAPFDPGDVVGITVDLDFTNYLQRFNIDNLTDPSGVIDGRSKSGTTGWFTFGDSWAGATAFNGGIFVRGTHIAAGTDAMIDDLKIVAVPEPGSILGLAASLVGLMGFAVRRRK